MLVGDGWLVVIRLLLMQSALGDPWDGSRRALGWLRDDVGMTPRQSREPWEDPRRVQGGAGEAMSDLSLRFQVFGGHQTL